MNQLFVQLTQQLSPKENSEAFGLRKINETFQGIEKYSEFSYNRLGYLDGVEQKTRCWFKIDAACVLYVNVEQKWWNENTDFELKLEALRKKVFSDWGKCLPAILGSKVEVHFIGSFSKLLWKDVGLKVDLMIAPNALNQSSQPNGTQLRDIQALNVVKALSRSLNGLRKKDKMAKIKQTTQNIIFSASLLDRATNLMEKKEAIYHEVARLANFWILICCPEKNQIEGLSALITLIATRKSAPNLTVMDGFQQFLHFIINWKQLQVDEIFSLQHLQLSGDHNGQPDHSEPGEPHKVLLENFRMRASFLSRFVDRAELSLRRASALQQAGYCDWFQLADVFLADRARRYQLGPVAGHQLSISLCEKKTSSCLFPKTVSSKLEEPITEGNLRLVSIAMSFVPRYDNNSHHERSIEAFARDFGKILAKVLKCTVVATVPQQPKMIFEMPYNEHSSILVTCF